MGHWGCRRDMLTRHAASSISRSSAWASSSCSSFLASSPPWPVVACGLSLPRPPCSPSLTLWLDGTREAVRAKLISSGIIGNDAYVVIAGPANAYGHYVTTREEYGVQRYEGASTLYGPCASPTSFHPRCEVTHERRLGSHPRGVHRQVHERAAVPRAHRDRHAGVRRADA